MHNQRNYVKYSTKPRWKSTPPCSSSSSRPLPSFALTSSVIRTVFLRPSNNRYHYGQTRQATPKSCSGRSILLTIEFIQAQCPLKAKRSLDHGAWDAINLQGSNH